MTKRLSTMQENHFNKQQTWIKKESGLFDATMDAYDGAEVFELVGSFLLYPLSLK